jgi:hypothetical protein
MRLRSVELELPRRDAAVEFFRDTWGLLDAGRRGPTAFLRGAGDHPYLVSLTEAAAPRAAAITFSGSEDEIGTDARIATAGKPAPERVAAFDEPGAPSGFFVAGPEGQVFRFVADREPGAAIARPETPVQLTHVVLNSLDREACARFTVDALGFAVSDRTRHMTFVRYERAGKLIRDAKVKID